MIKSGAQRVAAELGIMLVACDTSPRNTGIPGEAEDWEFGAGAGFYLDATEEPWSSNFNMYRYVTRDLYETVLNHFPIDSQRVGIFGHSMGGHGALVIAFRNPIKFSSVSAFAPICAPMKCAWGKKAFGGYLGQDQKTWEQYDASAVILSAGKKYFPGVLVDQGLEDKFLIQEQLMPEELEAACKSAGQPLVLRRHAGYDHGYFFISTFIEDHLHFHASHLAGVTAKLSQ